jgi:uncharacterized protein YdiU (UPF0061 family)
MEETNTAAMLEFYLLERDLFCSRETFLMKIGLKEERWGDEQLIEKLLDMMQQTGADFTATFRQLAEVVNFHVIATSVIQSSEQQ